MWTGKGYNINGEKIFELKYGKGNVKLYYNSNQIEYDGEYLNGEKNGKGKEYYYDELYKGEFLNGLKHGKFKIYDIFFKELIFKGEYLYDKKHGNGIEYFLGGNKMFEGYYLNGKKWNGTGYDKDEYIIYVIMNGNGNVSEYNIYGRLEFKGEYKNGTRNGEGREYGKYGRLLFEGEYKNGKKNGKGI